MTRCLLSAQPLYISYQTYCPQKPFPITTLIYYTLPPKPSFLSFWIDAQYTYLACQFVFSCYMSSQPFRANMSSRADMSSRSCEYIFPIVLLFVFERANMSYKHQYAFPFMPISLPDHANMSSRANIIEYVFPILPICLPDRSNMSFQTCEYVLPTSICLPGRANLSSQSRYLLWNWKIR